MMHTISRIGDGSIGVALAALLMSSLGLFLQDDGQDDGTAAASGWRSWLTFAKAIAEFLI